MKKYNHKEIEEKWQTKWRSTTPEKIDKDDTKEKYYILDMFPYPSGDGLHMGHTESYTSTDILYRYKKMNGYNVLHPQGFDSFGLPAENYAIKTGVHPKETTRTNIENYMTQMKSLGFAYDFDEKVITSSPDYYQWTQWLFTQFFENDLVYKKSSKTNWCESCKTILANEQVEDGRCERCKNEVVQKEVPGWFFKITEFADDLIDGLDAVDWPTHTKINQKNWIGKSEGALIDFVVIGSRETINVFTTRPDTLYGCTYMVLAPEHDLVSTLAEKIENLEDVNEYVAKAAKRSERDRLESKEKTGVEVKGVVAINPANDKEIPVYIADYVLAEYGTGAIMAVPAHDERDHAFAKQYDLDIVEVVSGGDDIQSEAYTGIGKLVNSEKFDGMEIEEAKTQITKKVEGVLTNTYRLRDWSISRQRYWGTPIPIVYDPDGVAHAVPKKHLPWTLPEDVDFVPTGEAPLVNSKELKERTEKIFGKGWTPETDTMDTFVDSSWYFLRYPDPHNEDVFCSEERKKWFPVDVYIGGAEHTYMHLLYARFFTKAMQKMGLIEFDEPFLTLRHQGMVLDKDGVKMSKSKGNVINPDDMVERFGADATRLYMMFAAPLEDDVMWNENGVVGTYRFLERVTSYVREWIQIQGKENTVTKKHERIVNRTIKKVTQDIEAIKYNTAIASLMTLLNDIKKPDDNGNAISIISRDDVKSLIQLVAPFAPHIAEELWEELGEKKSVHESRWPTFDADKLHEDTMTLAVQINGKVRDTITIASDASDETIKEKALESEQVQKWTKDLEIKRIIVVPKRVVSIVV